ncbi:MAG: serine hydrolase domain-containing protein, partial [Gemmatimonadaceae bacterium]
MRLPIACLALVTACSAPLGAQLPSLARLAARIDSAAGDLIAKKKTPSLSVAISQKGRTVYARAFGSADLEQHVAARPGTVYLIGSITKQFTAAAILKLVEERVLSLDDSLGKFFPAWPAATRGVTV